ncbi:putative nicotinamide N-methyase [Sphingopyxis panaciterrae]|uniref:class I SAM-dependent methyltransferase n=1 Tax=Sphingopyxis panaciterrae TaxID=363841 RepID=UPI00141D9B0E|nr:50S ribosomal protein L11 methyltransferase [Sphingopyxis panaciterrae]NIJ38187.1 putative nicotinamide N-methyase [Sphingopyxis panaciterrae]
MTPLDAAPFIRDNLPVHPVPGIPEIRLHKAAPESGLGRLAARDADGFGAPYWAHYWAGGLALARHVLDCPETVAGRRILDLGAGSGLVAIAAAKAGARQVIALDADPYAIAALGLNAALNGVRLDIRAGDVADLDPPAVDLILVGDLFYSAELAATVVAFLDRCGIDALIGDPWRQSLPVSRLDEITRYDVAESGSTIKSCGIFRFIACMT